MQAIVNSVLLLFQAGVLLCMLITLFDCQLSEKSPHTPTDAADQGDVVWLENLSHAVFDVLLVSLFLPTSRLLFIYIGPIKLIFKSQLMVILYGNLSAV